MIPSMLDFFARHVQMNFWWRLNKEEVGGYGNQRIKTTKDLGMLALWNAKGRRTKVSYNTKGYKTGTTEEYQSQWTTFDKASEAVELHQFDGVGLVLPSGIAGIDIDNIGADSELAQEVRVLMNTYEKLLQVAKAPITFWGGYQSDTSFNK